MGNYLRGTSVRRAKVAKERNGSGKGQKRGGGLQKRPGSRTISSGVDMLALDEPAARLSYAARKSSGRRVLGHFEAGAAW